jgi:antitoxin (DNA-binding transcriptional repressor) of toxin-antitoxin stability system
MLSNSMTQIATESIGPIWDKYFHAVDDGETILLTKNHVPVAEIRPIDSHSESNGHTKKLRPYGLAEGEFELPEDFDDPLPDDVLKLFTLE